MLPPTLAPTLTSHSSITTQDDLMIHYVGYPGVQALGTAYVMTLMVVGQFLILNLILAAVVDGAMDL
jgi:hypothetical protein